MQLLTALIKLYHKKSKLTLCSMRTTLFSIRSPVAAGLLNAFGGMSGLLAFMQLRSRIWKRR